MGFSFSLILFLEYWGYYSMKEKNKIEKKTSLRGKREKASFYAKIREYRRNNNHFFGMKAKDICRS
jgi:hypothetical protein